MNGNAAGSGSLAAKGTAIDNITTPYVWTNLNNLTSLEFTKDNGSGGNQKRITIYKIVCEYASSTPAKTLSSVAVSGTPTKTTYEAGEALNPAGLVVTGTYSDSSTGTITEGIDWTLDPETLSAGATTCDVMASVGNIESEVYTVTGLTVTAAKTLSSVTLSGAPTKTTYVVGEKFDFSGLTVTATYSDGTNEDVTSSASFYGADDALTYGTASFKTYATYGGKESSIQNYTITVKKASAIAIANINMTEGDVQTISAITTPENAPLTYNISQTDNFISIADGKITALKAGTATVTASYAGTSEYESKEATFTVTVKAPALITETTLAPANYSDWGLTSGSAVAENTNITNGTINLVGTGGNTVEGVKNSFNANASYLQVYSGVEFTVSVPSGYEITKIEFNTTTEATSSSTKYSPNVISLKSGSAGSYTYSGKVGTWTGTASSITFNATAQIRANSVVITYNTPLNAIPAPSLSSSAGASFTNTTTITINNPTAASGTTTYYTINDGDTQTYSAPFDVSATSTIKAWAQIASYKSTEASMTITKVEAPTTIAKWKTIGTGVATTGELTDALVTGINGKNVYVQDATGGARFYINDDATYPEGTTALAVGDKITGAFTATTALFNACTFQFTACDFSQATITSGNTVTPEAATVAQLTENFAAYEGKYVKVTGVELTDGTGTGDRTGTIKEGEATFTIYSGESGLTTPVVGATVNVTGYVSYGANSSQKEIIFLTVEDVKATALPTTVTFTTEVEKLVVGGNGTAVAESSYNGATISYSSSDTSIAEITAAGGVITAKAAGTATITATTADVTVDGITYKGNTASFTLTVTEPEASASIDYTEVYSSTTSGSTKLTGTSDNCGSATIAYAKGTNQTDPAYYASGTSVRVYAGNTLTISAAQPIMKIEIQYTSEKGADSGYSLSKGTMTVDANKLGTWVVNGTANTVTYTVGSTCSFNKITIYYDRFTLTVTSAGYATLCLPFNATIPSGVTAYTGTYNSDRSTVTLNAVEGGKLAKEQGYIVKAAEGTYTFEATNESVTEPSDNNLKGVLQATELSALQEGNYKVYALNKKDGNVQFNLATSGTLAANKAVLRIENTQGISQFISVVWGDEEATAINETVADKVTDGKFIENGQLIIVKGGVKYNVSGQVVK